MGNYLAHTLASKSENTPTSTSANNTSSSTGATAASPSVPLNITINQPSSLQPSISSPMTYDREKEIANLINDLKPTMLQNGSMYVCPSCPPCNNQKSEDTISNKISINPIQSLAGENLKKNFIKTQKEDDYSVSTDDKNPVKVTINRTASQSTSGNPVVTSTTTTKKPIETFRNYSSCSYNSHSIMYFFSVVLIILILLFILTKK